MTPPAIGPAEVDLGGGVEVGDTDPVEVPSAVGTLSAMMTVTLSKLGSPRLGTRRYARPDSPLGVVNTVLRDVIGEGRQT